MPVALKRTYVECMLYVGHSIRGIKKGEQFPVLREQKYKFIKYRNTWKNIISKRKSVVYLKKIM